jgi:hypothetical protein
VIGSAPDFADAKTKQLLESGIKLRSFVNENVMDLKLFPPVKFFKHMIQSLYSKTKGCVDGSAQARAIIRSTTISPQWEQNFVTQTFKTLAVNSIVAYRLKLKVDLQRSREEFRSISAFRVSTNSVQSLSDFVYDVSPNLLAHADKLLKQVSEGVIFHTSGGAGHDSLSNVYGARLGARALSRKRRRRQYFNEGEGRSLRLSSIPHIPNQTSIPLHCVLCGCKKTRHSHMIRPQTNIAQRRKTSVRAGLHSSAARFMFIYSCAFTQSFESPARTCFILTGN